MFDIIVLLTSMATECFLLYNKKMHVLFLELLSIVNFNNLFQVCNKFHNFGIRYMTEREEVRHKITRVTNFENSFDWVQNRSFKKIIVCYTNHWNFSINSNFENVPGDILCTLDIDFCEH